MRGVRAAGARASQRGLLAQNCADTMSDSDDSRRIRLLEHEVERLRLLVPKRPQREPKLIVLDLNGLLLYRRVAKDAASAPPPPRPFDKRAGAFHVWLRPHAASFLDFLLARFHVAIWSSAQLQNVLPLLKLLRPNDGDEKFAFVWSQEQCTDTGESHPENVHRPLFLKETSKIFEDPAHAGLFSAENTLLIDDDAYKAEQNLPGTCISPDPYEGESEEEECRPGGPHLGGLGPRAELRRWLGRLALAHSVTSFVATAPWPPTRQQQLGNSNSKMRESSAASDDVLIVRPAESGGGAGGRRAAASKDSRGRNGSHSSPKGRRADSASDHGGSSARTQGKRPGSKTSTAETAVLVSALPAPVFAPAPEPAQSEPAQSSAASARTVTAEERLEVTNALRTAVMQGDIEGLQLAVSVAQQLGLHSEAGMGQQKLERMLSSK